MMCIHRALLMTALIVALLGVAPAALAEEAMRFDTSDGIIGQDTEIHGEPGEEEPSGSSFLQDSLGDILGDFSVQSQMIYILADSADDQQLPSMLSATSSVANVYVGFKILSFEPGADGQPDKVNPWNAYMGFSYGLPDEHEDALSSPFGGNGYKQDEGGISANFGVSITF